MMPIGRRRVIVGVVLLAVVALGSCGDATDDTVSPGRPSVVVTTNILGDIVENLVGDAADVVVVMPPGASPHDFQASAQQAAQMRAADVLVVNGGGFEEGLVDVIDGAVAEGVPTFDAVVALGLAAAHDHHDHAGGDDPHFFTDPSLVGDAAEALLTFLASEVDALADDDLRSSAAPYLDALRKLDADVADIVAVVPPDDRTLVTGHEVFDHFAAHYGFEVIGTVLPGASTTDAASARALAALADTIRRVGVPAIFVDASSHTDLAATLAEEVGGIDVVELFTESLGEPGSGAETYLDMMRTNAERIAAGLS